MSPARTVFEIDGRMLGARRRKLCAEAGVARKRSQTIRVDLAALTGERGSAARTTPANALVLATPLRDDPVGPWRCAEELLDTHGRWACHVAYKCAAERVQADDAAGETFWSSVINALRGMQARLTCLAS